MTLTQNRSESSLFSVIILMAGISQLFFPFLYSIVTIAIYRYNHQYRTSLDAARQGTGQGQMQVAGGTRFPLAEHA